MKAILNGHTPGDDLEGHLLPWQVQHNPGVLVTFEHPDKSYTKQGSKRFKLYKSELLVLICTPKEELHDDDDDVGGGGGVVNEVRLTWTVQNTGL